MNKAGRGIANDIMALKALVKKDLLTMARHPVDLVAILVFNLASIIMFSQAHYLATGNSRMPVEVYVVQAWVIILFSLVLVSTRLFDAGRDRGMIQGILASPVSPVLFMVAKIIFAMIMLVIVGAVVLGLSAIVSRPEIPAPPGIPGFFSFLAFGMLIPLLDLAICGTMISAFSLATRNQAIVLPVLLFPLIIPVISPIIEISTYMFQHWESTVIFPQVAFIGFHALLSISTIVLVGNGVLSVQA